jgi:hypothetical protein
MVSRLQSLMRTDATVLDSYAALRFVEIGRGTSGTSDGSAQANHTRRHEIKVSPAALCVYTRGRRSDL